MCIAKNFHSGGRASNTDLRIHSPSRLDVSGHPVQLLLGPSPSSLPLALPRDRLLDVGLVGGHAERVGAARLPAPLVEVEKAGGKVGVGKGLPKGGVYETGDGGRYSLDVEDPQTFTLQIGLSGSSVGAARDRRGRDVSIVTYVAAAVCTLFHAMLCVNLCYNFVRGSCNKSRTGKKHGQYFSFTTTRVLCIVFTYVQKPLLQKSKLV